MSIHPRELFQSPERIPSRRVSFIQLSGDLFELLPASGSAWVMSGFMHQVHSTTNLLSTTWPPTTRTEPLVQISQWQVLTACIVYGCSVASFLRRQRFQDQNLPLTVSICVFLGILVGKCTGASLDYIMLVHVSWATCMSMLASVARLHIRPRVDKLY
jgi:hypothetical protein